MTVRQISDEESTGKVLADVCILKLGEGKENDRDEHETTLLVSRLWNYED